MDRTFVELGRVGGIRVRLDLTFIFALPLLAWVFTRSFAEAASLAGVSADQISGPRWAWGLALTVALFASVLLHELAHCWMLVRRGGRVRAVTLMLIGGATEMAEPPEDPRQEAGIALAGPVMSVLLGGAAVAASSLTLRLGWPTLGFALFYLGRLNVGLAMFNLLPAFPMDGGRVLRGFLLRRKSPLEATRIAANLGKAFAAAFAAYGFGTANLILVLIGIVVFVGATAEEQGVLIRTVLRDVSVRSIMTPHPSAVPPDASAFDVAELMIRDRHVAVPVWDGQAVVGFVRLERVEAMPVDVRRATPAGQITEPAVTIAPDAPALEALQLLGPRPGHLAVVEGGRLVGVVSPFDVTRGLRLRGLTASQRTRQHGGDDGTQGPGTAGPAARAKVRDAAGR